MKKYGLNGENINFIPTCFEEIEVHSIIECIEDTSLPNLFCKEKGVFVIVTDDPCNIYLTEVDLIKTFQVKNLKVSSSFSFEIPVDATSDEKKQMTLNALDTYYNAIIKNKK